MRTPSPFWMLIIGVAALYLATGIVTLLIIRW